MKQPGWVLLGDGCLRSVVPVLGRACTPSQELHTTGWSCWMWHLPERALGLMRYIKEKHLCLKGSLYPFLYIILCSFSFSGWCDGHWCGMCVSPGSLGSNLLKMF